jgi:hypothetical protein
LPRKCKEEYRIQENQVALQAAVQTGGIIIAVVVFLLAFQQGEIRTLGNQLVLGLSGGTIVCLFASATYYLKGSNIEHALAKEVNTKELNIMGDVFFTAGLLCLFTVPPLLFAIKGAFLSTAITLFLLIVIWNSLFSNRIGFFGIRLIASLCSSKIRKMLKLKETRSITDIRNNAFLASKESLGKSKGNATIKLIFLGFLTFAFLISIWYWLHPLVL